MNAKEKATELLSRVGFAALLGESTREDWLKLRSGFAEVLAYHEDEAIDAIRERDAARGMAENLAAEVDKLRAELEKTHTMEAILSAVRAALGIGEHADLAEEAKRLSDSIDYWRERGLRAEAEQGRSERECQALIGRLRTALDAPTGDIVEAAAALRERRARAEEEFASADSDASRYFSIIEAIRTELNLDLGKDPAPVVREILKQCETLRKRCRRAEEECARAETARVHAQVTADKRHDRLLGIVQELGISYPEDILDNLIEIRGLASPNPGESVLEALRRELVPARAEIGDKHQ